MSPTTLIIVGISGDLARRKLLPAIREIAAAGVLPKDFKLLGISRRSLSPADVLPEGDSTFLQQHLELMQMDLAKLEDYKRLKARLEEVEAKFDDKQAPQRLFYLSVPPQISRPLIELLGEAGLNQPPTKLLLEKPFGTDLASATELIESTSRYFAEEQLYRIDHYLAKEMAQNLVLFRSQNSLFKRTWNKDFFERIDIIATETIGIEGRGVFYEQTGALRDFVQNHLLQLAALTLMELPQDGNWQSIPSKRLAALKQLQPPKDVAKNAVRGQYQGYAEEAENPGSIVETLASIPVTSSDPRWAGVPITLSTGKALKQKTTEIRIRYKQDEPTEANELVLRLQPDEGVEIDLWAKEPGYDRTPQKVRLTFAYRHHFGGLPEAYERVFVDAMRGDRTLFITSEEVLAAWRLLEPIQQAWAMAGSEGLKLYAPGSSLQDVIANT